MADLDGPRRESLPTPPSPGPYVLKNVLEDIPLQTEDGVESVSITCVEHWNGNLYIGTSAAEILHLVALPAENELDPPTFILASRQQPSGHAATPPLGQSGGVQKILVLPGPSKACVLCNGVVSFYSLPELSPAFPNREPTGIQWIGGLDENQDAESADEVVVIIANSRRIMRVKVGDKLRSVKNNIEFPGCLRSSRRDTIACVADDVDYALLELEHQQKIPLSSISTLPTQPDPAPPAVSTPASRSSAASGHSRSTSLGVFSATGTASDASSGTNSRNLDVPDPEQRAGSPASAGSSGSRPNSRPRSSTDVQQSRNPNLTNRLTVKLHPHILSPSTNEFMFTTGTTKTEPGVGVFVNLDGDMSRGTIEFECYPESVLTYDFVRDNQISPTADGDTQVVLALFDKASKNGSAKGIEIQNLSTTSDAATNKTWLPVPVDPSTDPGGLHQCLSLYRYSFTEVGDLLQSVRFKPSLPQGFVELDHRTRASIQRLEQETALFEASSPQASSPTPEYEQRRAEEEKQFVARLGHASTRAIVWTGNHLWQILPNPLLLQLEHTFLQCGIIHDNSYSFESVDVSRLISLLGSIREREPQDETEYLTLSYIRQKTSIILFLHLQTIMKSSDDIERPCKMVGNALADGQIDPRVVLLLIPPLAQEALQGPNGIWLSQGIVEVLKAFKSRSDTFGNAPIEFWLMVRQYLHTWQSKRGYGSISDEKFVFDSVDAASLHTLLYLDQVLPEGSGIQRSTREKLENVVDHWKGDFQRAIVLLEHYRRFFILSRLYQSQRLAKDVLATWRRIVEGEQDEDRSLTIEVVETHIKRYLTKIKNAALFQEYGVWLAKRNPSLAIQVFADDDTTVKLIPSQVVTILKDQAPGAVQQYLEHLVFKKNLEQYADDLIGYYLDSVLSVLESSEEARTSLEQTYATYRAMSSPKPTYLNFIAENAPQEAWWQARLRLLQLLGSGGYATATASQKELTYSVDMVLERLTPFSSYLVSESIILDARQGRHKEALRLLTHGLGDYDTAIRYCYFGGPAPTSSQPLDASLLPSRETQQDLFGYLFHEFLQIEDTEECLERTSHLLGTFATWFDPLTVLSDIPSHWSVSMLSEFLLRSFRAARSERNQAVIVKALSAAQNLQTQAEFIDLCEKFGSQIETDNETKQDSEDLNTAVS